MNYRHSYHAGNFADVFKHIIVVALTQSLMRKEAGFCFLDTHAGAGSYDLSAEQALKSREFETGITKILAQKNLPPLVMDYLHNVWSMNATADTKMYPGSPWIVRNLIRPVDRIVLSELHPDEHLALRKQFAHDKQVAVHCQDAYQSLKAFLPPKERRGFVLIDPPYEKPDEFSQLSKAVAEAVKRWETGIYAIWYPIKNRAAIERFKRSFQEKISCPILTAEMSIHAEDISVSLNGCGMMIVNPPWQLDQTIAEVLPWLWQALSVDKQGSYQVVLSA